MDDVVTAEPLQRALSSQAVAEMVLTGNLLDESHRGSGLEYVNSAVRLSATLASAHDAIEGGGLH